MKIFVTGATGFIGSHFLNLAISECNEVIALKRTSNSSARVNLLQEPKWLVKPLPEVTSEDLANVDILVHLAAHSANYPYRPLDECLYWNLMAPLQLFEKARIAGVSNYLVTGSCFEYGLSGLRYDFIPSNAPLEPTQTYPASKAAASIAFLQWASSHNLSLSIARLFQVYGPGELQSRLWPSLCTAAAKGDDFPMTEGQQVRDFLHVTDVCRKLLLKCNQIFTCSQHKVEAVNIGSGEPMSILDFTVKTWLQLRAKGSLRPGSLPYREGEIMRYVPLI
jgi:nucleoside-diphosphate-sugar epimerase